MNLGEEKRKENYFLFLQNVYKTGRLRTEDCVRFHVTKGIAIDAESIGLIKRLHTRTGIVRWMPDEPPTIQHVNDLMKASSERGSLANKKRKMLKILNNIDPIVFPVVDFPVIHAPSKYTWEEWLEVLRKDPDFEYTLTRVRRNIQPEKLL
jgi:hypothetical protein